MEKTQDAINQQTEDRKIKARVDHCKEVASFELYRGHGHFLSLFLDAYLKADESNSLILLPAFEQFIKKYKFKAEDEMATVGAGGL